MKAFPDRTSVIRTSAGLLAAACLSACTADAGEPWGWVEGQLRVEAPSPFGPFFLDAVDLDVRELRLSSTTAGAGATGSSGATFDPANPPPGYSLCHGGHCHADDGRLVAYAEIEADLAGGRIATTQRLATFANLLDLGVGVRDLDEEPVVRQADADAVELAVDGLRIDGRITRDGDEIPVVISIGSTSFRAPLDAHFGPDEPQRQSLEAAFRLPADWWMGVDADALTIGSDGRILIATTANRDAHAALLEGLAEAELQAQIEDHDH